MQLIRVVVLKFFAAGDPFYGTKTAADLFFCQRCLDYSKIRFGHFLWVPQRPRKEANLKLQPAANWRPQTQIEERSIDLQHHFQTTVLVRLSWIMTQTDG